MSFVLLVKMCHVFLFSFKMNIFSWIGKWKLKKKKNLIWFAKKEDAISYSFAVPWKNRHGHTIQVPLPGEGVSTIDRYSLKSWRRKSCCEWMIVSSFDCASWQVPAVCLVGQIWRQREPDTQLGSALFLWSGSEQTLRQSAHTSIASKSQGLHNMSVTSFSKDRRGLYWWGAIGLGQTSPLHSASWK